VPALAEGLAKQEEGCGTCDVSNIYLWAIRRIFGCSFGTGKKRTNLLTGSHHGAGYCLTNNSFMFCKLFRRFLGGHRRRVSARRCLGTSRRNAWCRSALSLNAMQNAR